MADEPTTVDLAIVTVLPEEYQAVRSRLVNARPGPSSKGAPNIYAWELGEIPTTGGVSYSAVVGMAGRAGSSSGALATIATISRWSPRYVLLVGIAGGFDTGGLKCGDVVIADIVYGYEYGTLEKTFTPRHDQVFRADLGLLNGAAAFGQGEEWVRGIVADAPIPDAPKVLKGRVASGEKVVDDPTNELFAAILKAWPKLQAVEMEGAGAAAAIEQAKSSGMAVGFLMIRGISDMPRADKGTEVRGAQERDAWKVYAADTVAAFAIAYAASGLPTPPIQSKAIETKSAPPTDRLRELGLPDEGDVNFGGSEFTENLGYANSPFESLSQASRFVILAAIPLDRVASSATEIIRTAKNMLEPERWYSDGRSGDLPPKHWPSIIFKLPSTRRTARNAIILEDTDHLFDKTLVLSRLVISGSADVFFASAIKFVHLLKDGTPLFEIASILAQSWKLAGLATQLHQEIGYVGQTYLCVGMVGTLNSHLTGFADKWVSPYESTYWTYARHIDWSCYSPNLRICEAVDLMTMKPKEQPGFVNRFGEAISQAYNHDTPRCFEKGTGMLPRRYLERD